MTCLAFAAVPLSNDMSGQIVSVDHAHSFFNRLLKNFDVYHRIGIHLLELGVLPLQPLEAFCIGLIDLAVLFSSPMQRGD